MVEESRHVRYAREELARQVRAAGRGRLAFDRLGCSWEYDGNDVVVPSGQSLRIRDDEHCLALRPDEQPPAGTFQPDRARGRNTARSTVVAGIASRVTGISRTRSMAS